MACFAVFSLVDSMILLSVMHCATLWFHSLDKSQVWTVRHLTSRIDFIYTVSIEPLTQLCFVMQWTVLRSTLVLWYIVILMRLVHLTTREVCDLATFSTLFHLLRL